MYRVRDRLAVMGLPSVAGTVRECVRNGRTDAPALPVAAEAAEVVLDAPRRVPTAAGFTVEEPGDDFAPLTLAVTVGTA